MEKKQNMSIWMIMSLTFLSGYINVMGILLFDTPVSHFTGNISQFSVGLMDGDAWKVIKLFLTFILFFLGSFITGLVHYSHRPRLRNGYEYVLVAQCLFLLLFTLFAPKYMFFLIALYMGIQNGVFVFYDDIRVRFTHMTGYLTEFALDSAAMLKGHKTGKRVRFYMISISSFIAGGLLSSIISIFGKAYIAPVAMVLYYVMANMLYAQKH